MDMSQLFHHQYSILDNQMKILNNIRKTREQMVYNQFGCFSYPISSYTYLENLNKNFNEISDERNKRPNQNEGYYYSNYCVSTINNDSNVISRVIKNNNGNIEKYEERYNIPKRKDELKKGKHIRWLD